MCAFVVLDLVSSSTIPRDWLGRTSQKLPILCRVLRETLTQSINPGEPWVSHFLLVFPPLVRPHREPFGISGTGFAFLSPNQQCQSSEGNTKAVIATSGLVLSFLHPPPDSWWEGHYCLYTWSLMLVLLLLHPSNVFFWDNLVSQHQKSEPFWILLEQEIMEWQWHQLDHMEIICTLLQTDNHASTSPLSFYRLDALPAAQPTASKHWRHNWYIISTQ